MRAQRFLRRVVLPLAALLVVGSLQVCAAAETATPPCNNPRKDDRTMNTVGGFLKDTWRLARPYFVESDEKWSARGLLAVVIGLSLASVGLSVLLNFWRLEFYNAVQNKDWDGFVALLLLYRHDKNGFTF